MSCVFDFLRGRLRMLCGRVGDRLSVGAVLSAGSPWLSGRHLPHKCGFRAASRKQDLNLFRDTMLKLIDSPNLEYKHLTAKVQDVAGCPLTRGLRVENFTFLPSHHAIPQHPNDLYLP